MIFLLTNKCSLAQSANSQQPTANSQQPTANSQQPTANSQQPTANSQTLTKIIFYFTIQNFLLIRAVSEFGGFSLFVLWLLFFYAYCEVIEVSDYKKLKKLFWSSRISETNYATVGGNER